MAEEKVSEFLGRFQRAFLPDVGQPNVVECQSILVQIKLQLVHFQLIPPFTLSPAEVRKQLLLARETMELATLLSVEAKDEAAFERHMNQVKIYYHDYAHLLPPSERKGIIIGLLLLNLLSQNKLGEFHTEMELIPPAEQQNLYVAFPIHLEKRLMEGSYNQLLNLHKDLPHPSFGFFANKLAASVRSKIAECTAKAYLQFPRQELDSLLGGPAAAETVLSKVKDCNVSGDQVVFTQPSKNAAGTPSFRLITENLLYATELERII